MRQTKGLPRLRRRTTAFTFLSRVLPEGLIAEPRRLRMSRWVMRDLWWLPKERRPPCGTAACAGGWTELMVYGRAARPQQKGAIALLSGGDEGVTEALDDLFYGPLTAAKNQGTLAHARAVAGRLRAIARRHEGVLRRVVLEPRWRAK